MIFCFISGTSGSGKTYLAKKLGKKIKSSIIFHTDDYYKDDMFTKFASLVNNSYYDNINSIHISKLYNDISKVKEGVSNINTNKYNFKTKISERITVNINKISDRSLIIVEGIFAFNMARLLKHNNIINILISERKEICYKRRLERDMKFRKRDKIEVTRRFEKGWYLFQRNLLEIEKNIEIYKLIHPSISELEKLVLKFIKT